ncbi:ATP-binding protein [Rhodobacterales bacterium HKCCSP123]|nr:ATP-binding protein [Rhodobacterales bacterium HKCCSP123]
MPTRGPDTPPARLDLPPRLSAVAMLNDWFAGQTAGSGLSERVLGDMKLCLNEAVANVVSYAFDGIADPRLRVTLRPDADGITAEIRDNGQPFDPLAGPMAEAMHGLETAQIGGFGIKLMRETAQDLSYAREGEENVLTLTCRAAPGSAAPAP